MQTFICKCGKQFKKSTNASTTGYILENYTDSHECYGCPYIVFHEDWETKEIVKVECRATPSIKYQTHCRIGTKKRDFSMCYFYTLDLDFAKEVYDFCNTLEGSDAKHTITSWRSADFDTSDGTIKFPLYFKANSAGTIARNTVYNTFFANSGKRNISEETEKVLILKNIRLTKAIVQGKQLEEDNSMALNIPTQKIPTLAESMGELLGNKNLSQGEQSKIKISQLRPYERNGERQPFRMYTQAQLVELANGIKQLGVLSPIIVRPTADGTYMILAGHNRTEAAKLAGLTEIPAIIKDVDDSIAQLIMVSTNLDQRREMLPSEKAWGYRLQKESLEERYGTNCPTISIMAEQADVNRKEIHRYIRLTYLSKSLLQLVDDGKIPAIAGYYISFISEENQRYLYNYYNEFKPKIDIEVAEKLRNNTDFSFEGLDKLFNKKKKKDSIGTKKVSISDRTFSRYFGNFTKEETEKIPEIIEKALEKYFENN